MTEAMNKAWEVFRSVFKDGEEVIVEHWDGTFHHGKLLATNDHIILTRPHGESSVLLWEDVEFIAHDGFPVHPLVKMSKSEATDLGIQTPNDVIRNLLETKRRSLKTATYYGGGCPFIAGPASLVEIHNEGNTGPLYDWRLPDLGEVLVFESPDGARMHSYDTNHLFLL